VEDRGLESIAFSSENTVFSESGGAKSGAVPTGGGIDPELALVIEAWPILPDIVKTQLLRVVRNVSTNSTPPLL